MKLSLLSVTALCLGLASTAPTELEARKATVEGFDISNYQASVDFEAAYKSGARFVIIKATGGTEFVDERFDSHYKGATDANLIRGGYHFARPGDGSGAEQAQHFLKNGGGWSGDNITLPGMLDIETNPSGDKCYGLSHQKMIDWIKDFADTYKKETSRYPLLYTSPSWWKECTGNSKELGKTCPLVLARWEADSPGTVGGWEATTFWQYNDNYKYGGDSDRFMGDEAGLKKIASG